MLNDYLMSDFWHYDSIEKYHNFYILFAIESIFLPFKNLLIYKLKNNLNISKLSKYKNGSEITNMVLTPSKIIGIQFSVLSPDEIRKGSVAEYYFKRYIY